MVKSGDVTRPGLITSFQSHPIRLHHILFRQIWRMWRPWFVQYLLFLADEGFVLQPCLFAHGFFLGTESQRCADCQRRMELVLVFLECPHVTWVPAAMCFRMPST